MVRLGQILVVVLFLVFCNSVFAQFKSSSSARSYGMGGFGESVGDDPLTLIDNLSAMGRDAKQRSHLMVSFGQVNFWDYQNEQFTTEFTEEDAQFNFFRLAYIPQFKEDSAKWMVWVDSIMPSVAWEGRVSSFTNPDVNVIAKFLEIGFGFGFAFCDEVHMGLGVGMTFAFTKYMHFSTSPPAGTSYKTISDLSMLPVGHFSLEYFIIPEFVVSLNSVAFISYFSEYTNDANNWDDISATYLAGSGFLEISLSMAYEISPFFHITGGVSTISYKKSEYVYDEIEDWMTSFGLGGEYIVKLGNTYSQLAIRAGFFMENMTGVAKDEDADSFWFYSKTGFRIGFALKLGAFILNAAISQPFNSQYDQDVETLKISAGFRFK